MEMHIHDGTGPLGHVISETMAHGVGSAMIADVLYAASLRFVPSRESISIVFQCRIALATSSEDTDVEQFYKYALSHNIHIIS